MTAAERLRQIVSALPSDASAVTLTRADITALLEGDSEGDVADRDMTVDEVATETGRAASTVRGWLIWGALRGYKMNKDWRVRRPALRAYMTAPTDPPSDVGEVEISAWRKVRGA